jgi:L-aminopeptidase/D-esterase-like protein
MKSGLGWSVSKKGDLFVYALAAVNAYGAVKDAEGRFMAGAVGSTVAVQSPTDVLLGETHWAEWGRNTTLIAVVTNAEMDKADCRRVAFMAASGMAESIFPVNTPFDGDTLFCVSTGQKEGECLEVGMLAAMAVSEAVRRSVRHAGSAWGFPGLGDGNQ